MAKLLFNPVVQNIRGKIGELVFRLGRYGPSVGPKAAASSRPPTPAQLTVRQRFKLAAVYAATVMADPAMLASYEPLANARNLDPRILAMADYLNAPEVHSIDLTGFHGGVGQSITVQASDDVSLTDVTVAFRDAANVVIEDGAATLVNGRWVYTLGTNIPSGTAVTIGVTATDRPGNTGTLSVPTVIA